ncbi:MAG: biosynthetic-type acetolactate synthase large subunit [Aquificaceae bacterium]|nr:MAG: biosynthetic-type acetolactate synthase large subunit [Aquificaceae bacterium]
MELTGAEIFVECLKAEGVETIFGYPGGAVLFLYDELAKAEKRGEIRHILARHEQGAVHAAEGYAKSTDKPGVAIVTSGPGATNAVTGIADAYMDSVPLVVFTGQVPRYLIGNDAFQEVDIVGITRPCVKHNFLVTDVKDIAETIKKAFYIATTGRPGPVLIDIPKDITDTDAKCEFHYPESLEMRSYNPILKSRDSDIQKAVDMILNAERPIIYTGGGVIMSGASDELRHFTQNLNFPITNTLMGLGAYPATDKQFVGMLGMHGTYEANMSMHHSDLIIAIGARFDDRVTGNIEKFCPDAKIIHVDIDPASISKNIKVDCSIVGDVKPVLLELSKELKQRGAMPDQTALAAWWKRITAWQKYDCLKYSPSKDKIKAQYIVQKFWEISAGDSYVCSDVGQHQMWAAQFYKFDKPNRWINSGGLGTMGFGLPAAMGVQLAHPDADVACITGDGSIQMCIQELGTCQQYNLPLNIISLNNGYLGMVRQWQEFFYQKNYAMSYNEALPDFVKLAEAYGHVGLRIEKAADVEGALKEALDDKKRLYFLDFITEAEENVYPMIPAGAGLNEMKLL